MKKCIHIFWFPFGWSLVLLFSVQNLFSAVDPFSKIIIESGQACCYKDPMNSKMWVLHYDNNVRVTFADKSSIVSDHLEIAFNVQNTALSDKKKNNQQNNFSSVQLPSSGVDAIKHIVFKDNVTVTSEQRHATAQKATLYLAEKVCNLEGNVVIGHQKNDPKDIPFEVRGDSAQFDFSKDMISFTGRPVSSSFDLSSVVPKKKNKVKSH